ncbi:MAG TPA: FIST C-terminal domain-containing protein [Candidatus Coprovivens excrementavium]|nr:FIST C-terminal domain-containing protein [Candidatus Coprovivens excrementavium]
MKAMVGSSILANSFDAGVETAKNSMKGIKAPKVGLLFTSIKYNQNDVIKGIKSVSPDLKVIGCTSSGAIMTPDGIISSDDGFAGMMVLEDNELTVGVAASPRGNDPRATGRKIAREAMADAGKKYAPVAFAMFASPAEEEYYLKGIQDELGEIPMFGGSAADDAVVGEWKVFCENQSFGDGCAIALFYTTKEIKNVFTGAYNETDNVGIVTKVEDDRRIVEIDHVPALKKYAEWTGLNPDELMGQNLLVASIPMALGVKTIQGDLTAVRHPMVGNPDYSFNVGAKVAEKTAIIQLQTDVDGLIEGAVSTIKELKQDFKAGAMFLVHCGGRKLHIGDRVDEDFVAIKNAAGDTPFIVAFTFGEYGQRNHSGATIGGLSLSFTGFSE